MNYEQLQQDLFNRRFHGTVNLRGIDFQIIYALYSALDLLTLENTLEKITLEGIEDIDLKPFQADNIFVQVKTSVTPWHLSDLAAPLMNFMRLNDISEKKQKFQLIFNFKPRDTFENLFSQKIPIEEKENLIKEILKLKEIKSNNISREQIVAVVSNCEIKNISKDDLVRNLKKKIHNFLDIQPNEVEYFFLSILYKFIDWSIERKTLTKANLLDFKVKYSENKERSIAFEAYGRGLIDRISWVKESQSSDYFEGKKTRSGHIALDLDVKRPKWLKKIDDTFQKTNVCVIKEASGQGKSTLAFRYAHDYWNQDYTFTVKVVETTEQAEQISNYLKSLSELGFTVSVLIDDINSERRYFSNILQNCANHQVSFLITSRNDDYQIFGDEGIVSSGFVYPYFNREEASQIFQNLKKENRIHSKKNSSDWAFERIDSPKCLIEFIFLITQGEMLHERLSQQIQEIRANNQAAKIDFLRKIIIADICRTPLNINQVLIKDTSNTDYQGILKSLNNEFISIENDYIKGYHWVRSSHLLKILHEDYVNPAITALKTLSLLENDKMSIFIGNLIDIPNFDVNILINHFKSVAGKSDINTYLSFISGIFKIGEFQFFLTNKEVYDEAYKKFNEGALFLLNSKYLPTKQIDLFEIFGENRNFKEVKELSKKIIIEIRGFNLAKAFTESNIFNFEINTENLGFVGNILDWSYWLNRDFIDSNKIDELMKNPKMLDLEINSFGLFSQSLFRKYPEKHDKWFKENRSKILKKLENLLQCSISLDNNSVSITYTHIDNGESFNDATVKRLSILRSCLPFCEKYKGHHTFMPLLTKIAKIKYKYAHDESFKDIPSENLLFASDVEKNRILGDLVESHYRVKTWYEFTEYYYYLRQDIIDYSENVCRRLKGFSPNFNKKDDIYIDEKILHSFKQMPIEIESLKEPFSNCRKMFNDFKNFLIMKSDFVQNEFDENAKRELFVNYNNFLIELPKMQVFFTVLKEFSPDYFHFEELNSKETKVFNHLKELLKINIPDSKHYWDLDSNFN